MLVNISVNATTNWRSAYAASLARLNPKTSETYLQHLRVFERWFVSTNGQPFTPDFLTGWDLRTYREHSLEVERVKPATWNGRRAALRVLCAWARKAGYISIDPMVDVAPAQQQRRAPRWLKRFDFAQLMRRMEIEIGAANTADRRSRAVRDAAIIALMAYAGLREGEVVELRMDDIQIRDRSGKIIVRRGKRDKYREVPLSREARRFIGAWIGEQAISADADAYVFPGEHGGPLTARALQKRISRYGAIAQIEVTPHRLRHSFAKRLIDAGRPEAEVQELLGHEKRETTDRYTWPGWEDLEEAVEIGSIGNKQ